MPLMLTSLMAMILPSCEDDAPTPVVESGAPTEESALLLSGKLQMAFEVKSVGDKGSRTSPDATDGSLFDGEHGEHEIGSAGNYALFFNADKYFMAYTILAPEHAETPDENVIESVYKTNLNPEQFEELPSYCLVVLNGDRYTDTFAKFNSATPVDTVLNQIWSSDGNPYTIGRDSKGRFTMTNSIYYDASGALQTVVPVTPDMVYDRTDPESKFKAKKLTVYVERMVAKFSFEVSGNDRSSSGSYTYDPKGQQLVIFEDFNTVTGAPMYVSRKWCIELTGWGINGLESSGYLFKKISSGKNYFSAWNWKDPAAYRTYWGEDTHYTGSYPLQYRKSVDRPVTYYENLETSGKNVLRNYSYAELELDGNDFDRVIYAPENTYDYAALNSSLENRTDLLAGTHLLVGGRLKVADASGAYSGYTDLYRDRDGFYYTSEKDCLKAMVYAFNAAITSQDQMRYVFYSWGNANGTSSANGDVLYAQTAGAFSLYLSGSALTNSEIDKLGSNFLQKATVKTGDGRRLPWPMTGTLSLSGTVRICDASGKYLRNATEDDIRSLLFEWIGPLDHFNQGRLYYCAPALIKKGLGSNGSDVCGVVRNGWYAYNLSGLKSIGTPVDDLNQPIVPDPVSNHDQLNLTVNILDWHYEETNADILP